MFSRDALQQLYRHMEWADARMWSAMLATEPTDEKIKSWVVHIHVVQRAFITVWRGDDWKTVFRTPDEFPTLADVRAWARPYYAEAHQFLGGTTDDQLAQALVMPWSSEIEKHIGRPPGVSTLGDTCFQVTSHTTHHRAQISARLRELGAEPPLVDYIGWLWFDRPPADWTG